MDWLNAHEFVTIGLFFGGSWLSVGLWKQILACQCQSHGWLACRQLSQAAI
jgi:hypothetical protein